MAAHVAASAVELSSLGESFGHGVGLFTASNEKLVARAARIVSQATGRTVAEAEVALAAAGKDSKLAILMLLTGEDAESARRQLAAAGGVLRRAIAGATQ